VGRPSGGAGRGMWRAVSAAMRIRLSNPLLVDDLATYLRGLPGWIVYLGGRAGRLRSSYPTPGPRPSCGESPPTSSFGERPGVRLVE
jgi:hypothetical protein